MEFQGIYFDPQLADGKSPVVFFFRSTFVEFSVNGQSHSWNFSDIRVSIGGSNHHLVFFNRKDRMDISFYIPSDASLRQFLLQRGPMEWRGTIQSSIRDRQGKTAIVLSFVLLIVLGIGSVVYFRGEIAKSLARHIPYSTEKAIGDRLVDQAVPSTQRVGDEKLKRQLEKVLDPLRRVLPDRFRDFKVYISQDTTLNAFALPGGHIVFNLGSLEAVENAHELLGVAAHEMAHVTERHVVRGILQGAGLFLVFQTLLGDISGIVAVIADQGSFLLNQSFSRDMETEADQAGLGYMLQAEIDPRGMSLFFAHIVKEYKKVHESMQKIEKYTEFLSTHPDTEGRMKTIDEFYAGLSNAQKAKLKTDVPGFKELKRELKRYKKEKES